MNNINLKVRSDRFGGFPGLAKIIGDEFLFNKEILFLSYTELIGYQHRWQSGKTEAQRAVQASHSGTVVIIILF